MSNGSSQSNNAKLSKTHPWYMKTHSSRMQTTPLKCEKTLLAYAKHIPVASKTHAYHMQNTSLACIKHTHDTCKLYTILYKWKIGALYKT